MKKKRLNSYYVNKEKRPPYRSQSASRQNVYLDINYRFDHHDAIWK